MTPLDPTVQKPGNSGQSRQWGTTCLTLATHTKSRKGMRLTDIDGWAQSLKEAAAPLGANPVVGTTVFWTAIAVLGYALSRLLLSGSPSPRSSSSSSSSSSSPPTPAPLPEPETKDMTREELALYDGTHAEVENRIYLACKGTIFDVTSKPGFYGPEGGYHAFVARDASWGLAKTLVTTEDGDLSTLSASERDTLDQWYHSYCDKYHIVGKVLD